MTRRDPAPVALLVVPPGTVPPEPLAEAITTLHPEWRVVAVWAGDPQLRPPVGSSFIWLDATVGAAEVVLTQSDERADWWFGVTSAAALLVGGAPAVVVVRAGSVAVLGPIDELVEPLLSVDVACPGVVFDLVAGPLPDDGYSPSDMDLLRLGSVCTSIASFGPSGVHALRWLAERLSSDEAVDVAAGRLLERAAQVFGLVRLDAPSRFAGATRWMAVDPSVIDLTGFRASSPWTLLSECPVPLRVEIASPSPRSRAIARALPQVAGERRPVRVPGGWIVDDVLRRAVRTAKSRATVPDPWSDPSAFREVVTRDYWTEFHANRPDLRATFPDPGGADAEPYGAWRQRAAIDDDVPLVISPSMPHVERWPQRSRRRDGLDLVGYHLHESSLGDVVRRISTGLGLAGVSHGDLAHRRTGSPLAPEVPSVVDGLEFATSLVVVNADQFPALAMDHPELFAADTHLVGYWFWELEHVPKQMREAASMVDEIWVGSQFVADAFRTAVDTPVRHVPIPVPAPVVSARDRASFPTLAPIGERFVFAVVFDHFSVTERKNPVGVIEAFRRAFAPDEGPVLVVKSMNASRRWPQHQHVVAAAGDRTDIVLWDEHLDRSDHMAFIAGVDALVSLHRSEGLGLHLAEAMWLGTPVIATRYSGNLDLMDDDCSILVDTSLVHVERGEGVYPAEALWADPDLDQAAAAMRSLASDPSRCAALAAAGLARMQRQPTLADAGRMIAGLLGIEVAS